MWKDKFDFEGLRAGAARLMPFLYKNRYLLVVLLAGLLLLTVGAPRGEAQTQTDDSSAVHTAEGIENGFSLDVFQTQLKEQLARIDGAGRVELMLSLQSTEESVYASNIRQSTSGTSGTTYENTLSVVSDGSYGEAPVQVKRTCPTFRGAVVLCDGADHIQVRLAITEAVSAVCGIGADKITVLKMQSETN